MLFKHQTHIPQILGCFLFLMWGASEVLTDSPGFGYEVRVNYGTGRIGFGKPLPAFPEKEYWKYQSLAFSTVDGHK
jgi:hypothetical protein